MFRRTNWVMWAAVAAVAGYFFKDKLPAGLKSIYERIEEKIKG